MGDWDKLGALDNECKVDAPFAIEYLDDRSLAIFIKNERKYKQLSLPDLLDEVTAHMNGLLEPAEKEFAKRRRLLDAIIAGTSVTCCRPPCFNPAPTDIDKLTNDQLEYHIMSRKRLIAYFDEKNVLSDADLEGFIKKCEEEVSRRKGLKKKEKNAANPVLSEIYRNRDATAELRKFVDQLEEHLEALEISTEAAFNV